MNNKANNYAVIVIGGGHAGAEAAWAACNMLRDRADENSTKEVSGGVALITMDPDKIGAMSCNPAIGGLAKGQMVREIDALGGLMALASDATGIQFRILNRSKGPAVRGPRCQSDKYQYAREVQRLLSTRDNLDILSGTAEQFVIEDGRCTGVIFHSNDQSAESRRLSAEAVVLTTGTFMRGLMHTGESKTQGGRVGEPAAVGISGELSRLGFELGRLKTGTPPRLAAESIDFDSLTPQPGDQEPTPFSDLTCHRDTSGDDPAYQKIADRFPVIEQLPCHITHTTEAAHERIRDNLDRAPMYNGQIETAGPRYCPSIEDKVVRFAERPSHHVFLEPESLETNEVYCNGISTSLPADVQDFVVAQLPGCEKAKILRYGYAVEYDMVRPHQIDATCMTKRIEGLFLAGQINGTSGYEEAAGQGLIAGVNAVCYMRGENLIRLNRDQAYIGVLLDDLVTKIPREPYRMFTSRAEYRLILRADNADQRLTPLGRDLGLVDDTRWSIFQQRRDHTEQLQAYLSQQKVGDVNMLEFMRRPEANTDWLLEKLNGDTRLDAACLDRTLISRLLAEVQYAGYVERQRREVEKLAQQEQTPLPTAMDYRGVSGLRKEAANALDKFKPATLGQAGRLAGVTPADLMLLVVAIGK